MSLMANKQPTPTVKKNISSEMLKHILLFIFVILISFQIRLQAEIFKTDHPISNLPKNETSTYQIIPQLLENIKIESLQKKIADETNKNENFITSSNLNAEIKQYPIKLLPYSQFIEKTNPFLEDCLNTLIPPTSFFDKIEVIKTQVPSVYFIRLFAKLHEEDRIDFAKNEIQLLDDQGKLEIIRFDSKKFALQRDEKEDFSVISFTFPAPRKIKIPMLFRQKTNHRFDLEIDLRADGSIKNAFFTPIIDDFNKRKRFCPKSRRAFASEVITGGLQQDLTNVGGTIQGTYSGQGYHFEWAKSLTISSMKIYNLQFKKSNSILPEFSLFDSQKQSRQLLKGQYILQYRFLNLQFPIYGTLSSPFWRYGIGLDQLNSWHFKKADQVILEKNTLFQGLAGIGIEFYTQNRWMFELSLLAKIQAIGLGSFKNLIGFDGRFLSLYSPNFAGKTLYLGIDSKINTSFANYNHNNGIDRSGFFRSIESEISFILGQTF